MSKIHTKQLNRWSKRPIPISKGKSGEERIAVRDLDGKYSKSEGEPVYILSNQIDNFERLADKLTFAENVKAIITISFVKKFTKKFINNIEIL